MICFLSKEKDDTKKVKSSEIVFVHVPDKISSDEIKVLISPKAKLFADTLNLNTVFLHCGEEIIEYDYQV